MTIDETMAAHGFEKSPFGPNAYRWADGDTAVYVEPHETGGHAVSVYRPYGTRIYYVAGVPIETATGLARSISEIAERRRASRHTMFFDQTGPTELGRTYLTFGCNNIECGYRDFVVADDYAMACSAAMEAFSAVDAHAVEVL